MSKITISSEERFWKRVNKNGPTPEHCPELGPCWIMSGYVNPKNGRVYFQAEGKKVSAARYSWTITFGEIPADMSVLHHCDTPACIRGEHLFLGTQADNMDDKTNKGRQLKGEQIHNAKLTAEQVLEIRRRHQPHTIGCLQLLSAEFGVNEQAIVGIVNRSRWKHV